MGNSILQGSILLWRSHDSRNLMTVVVKHYLDSQFAANSVKHQRIRDQQHPENQQVGLELWCVDEESRLSTVLAALPNQRRQYPKAVQLVYLVGSLASYRPQLLESGAHWVSLELSELPEVLDKIFCKLNLSSKGTHPLTSGLMEKLPWADSPGVS